MKNPPFPRPDRSPRRSDRERVDAMVVQILSFIASDPDRLGRFFDLTGLTVETLRKSVGTRSFDASLLDYLGSDEALLLAFAAEYNYNPADVDRIRLSLSGPVPWSG